MNAVIFGSIRRAVPVIKAATAAILVFALTACGGGGTTPVTDVTTTAGGLRPLSVDFISRKAVNYSPFRTSLRNEDRASEVITDAQVLEDLTLIQNAGFGMVRVFNSDEKVAQRVLRVIQDNGLDLKVYLGMWMAGNSDVSNQNEIAFGVALANSFPNIVAAVSVGNESLVSWSDHKIQPTELARNIATVRRQIAQPVTTDDNWLFYAKESDRAVFDVIDFAAVHTYSMVDTHFLPDKWDWKQLSVTNLQQRAAAMMDAAMASTKADYQAARSSLDSKGFSAMPIVIGETGWMAVNPSNKWYTFLAHPVNQKMYLDRLMAWAAEGKAGAGPKNVFYFEAFDEPWKGDDNGWGLFNVAREARCSAQSLKPSATWLKEAGSCNQANAIFFQPPQLNSAVTDAKLIIHSEAVTGWPPGMRADAFDGGTFVSDYPAVGDSASGDLGASLPTSNFIRLRNFTPRDYGWGLLWQSVDVPVVSSNMSNFAGGSVNFSIKTSYAGKLRIGLSSDTELGRVVEANVLVAPGDSFGYCSNSPAVWCDVRIPLSAFKAANPDLDLRFILTRLSVADIYSETGNTARTGLPEIRLDNIFWAR